MKSYEMINLSISKFLNQNHVCYNMDVDMNMIQATLVPWNTHIKLK